ncbi:MAG: DUF2088 domain-containing protein, partial [Proteobacteria bacterium]|nr:DUF2088 domain-containing protein [Pseudomonadota bacterium]
MKKVKFPVGKDETLLQLPDETDILSMPHPVTLTNPVEAVKKAINQPIETLTLQDIVKSKDKNGDEITACIVISDNTRPVPYKGEQGILYPIVEILLESGLKPENILVLVATGTHRGLKDDELAVMLDKKVFQSGVRIENHDCHDDDNLSNLGKTVRGSDILINS